MKKFAKMSLVAAVAVAGFTSYSSASSLEEAVKNTDISGYLRYRIETNHEDSDAETTTRLKYLFKTKTKVNDFVTANTQFVNEAWNEDNEIKMTMGYFTYANKALTVSVGRQPLVSPLTDSENAGDGIVATYNVGPVTFAGAYYTSIGNNGDDDGVTNKNVLQYKKSSTTSGGSTAGGSGIDHYGIGILGSFDPVNFQAWYLATADELNDADTNWGYLGTTLVGDVDGADAFALEADAQLGPVGLYAFYSQLDLGNDSSGTDDIDFLNLKVSGDIGPVALSLDYVRTGDDSGDTTLDGDTDAQANTGLKEIDLMNFADGDFFIAKVSGNVTDTVNLELAHLNGEGKHNFDTTKNAEDNDVIETRFTAKYTMSKNFTVTGQYSFGEDENNTDEDFKTSRIELKYTF